MKNQVYIGIAIRIILLCGIAMATTFIPEHLREFFGDVYDGKFHSVIDEGWDWGPRHGWWLFMMLLLFILSLINCIIGSINLVLKYYPELNK